VTFVRRDALPRSQQVLRHDASIGDVAMEGLVRLIFDQTDYSRQDIQDIVRNTNTTPTRFRWTRLTNIDATCRAPW
jgi:hypothetical protein